MKSKTYHETKNGIECKKCCKCKEWLRLEEFNKDRTKWDNLHSTCKKCANSESSRRNWMRYYYSHKKELMHKKVEYNRKRYNHDCEFRLRNLLRGRLRYALKDAGVRKKISALNLVGCTIEFLKVYLEGKFDESMSWDNYGTYWEIDHIKPCSKFDLSEIDEQRACFHYTNLQPLSAYENRVKSNKFIFNEF